MTQVWKNGEVTMISIIEILFVLHLRNVINIEVLSPFVNFCLSFIYPTWPVFFVFVYLFYPVFLTLDQSQPSPGKEGLYFFCICVIELVYLFSPVFLTPGRLQP